MSKGLEALKEIKKRFGFPINDKFACISKNELDIIETSLKENAELKRANFELEERIGFLLTYKGEDENKVKAFEIIKEKGIVVQFIKETNSVEQYNAVISGLLLKPLTQEEYDLLKKIGL